MKILQFTSTRKIIALTAMAGSLTLLGYLPFLEKNSSQAYANANCNESRGLIDWILRTPCETGSQAPVCSLWPSSTGPANSALILSTTPTFVWKTWTAFDSQQPDSLLERQRIKSIRLDEIGEIGEGFYQDFDDNKLEGILRNYSNHQRIQQRETKIWESINVSDITNEVGYWQIHSFTPNIALTAGKYYQYTLTIEVWRQGYGRTYEDYPTAFQVIPESSNHPSKLLSELRSNMGIPQDLLSKAQELNTDLTALSMQEQNTLSRAYLFSRLHQPLWADVINEIFSVNRPSETFKELMIYPLEVPETCSLRPFSITRQ